MNQKVTRENEVIAQPQQLGNRVLLRRFFFR
jgi:hypothetical protein